jgi:glutaredoxin-like protein
LSLIPAEQSERLKVEFTERLERLVTMMLFTQELECKYCAETRQLATEVAALSEKIKVDVYDFVVNADKAREYGVDKVPAIVIESDKNHRVKYYGFPFGYEFQTLVEALENVSRGRTDLSTKAKELLREVRSPVHVQVFVTLTCPHCPVAAATAHKFAVENDLVSADVVDVGEFSYLAVKYGVVGVPKVVINEKVEFVGVLAEDLFLEHLILAAA